MRVRSFAFFLTIIFSSGFFMRAEAGLVLSDIHTASKDVLAVFFTSDTVDVQESDISDISQWKVNGKPVLGISKYVMQADACDHTIYLQVPALKSGKTYTIETPYGSGKMQFDETKIFCEAIKTNQAGYSALSKVRYANFAIWLGTGGSRKIDGSLPVFKVIRAENGKKVISGVLQEIGKDSSSGDIVYRIDLREVPEGGPYKVVVKGYGCSHPFGIGGEFSKKLAHTIFRAQYLQRCGCPVHEPDIRKNPCHTLIYNTDGAIGEANVVVQGDEPTFHCYGGYHDAGDADRRAYHMANPIINLMIYEAFPDVFADGQFHIPGDFDENYQIVNYENGIPDIIDEAEWGTLVWEYLQNEDGSIHFGTETKGYPDPFDAPMDLDQKRYGTVKVDPRATCTGAGLFMHLARILKPYKPERAEALFVRAEKAMAYGSAEMASPEKLYYYIQKYLLTGDETAHAQVKTLYTLADVMKTRLFTTPGYSLNDEFLDNPAYFYSYIIDKSRPTDPDIVAFFKQAIQAAADSNVAALKAHAYPVGNDSEKGGWGHNVRQPQYACAPMLQWALTGDQQYIDAASELMDWKLGLNPLGISYVTGLGFHRVQNPHDRESAYTKKMGWGPKPGITVFGPGVVTRWVRARSVPLMEELAKERQFTDDMRIISFTEFTIFETMHYDALYTVLARGGKWSGRDPFSYGN